VIRRLFDHVYVRHFLGPAWPMRKNRRKNRDVLKSFTGFVQIRISAETSDALKTPPRTTPRPPFIPRASFPFFAHAFTKSCMKSSPPGKYEVPIGDSGYIEAA